MSKPIEVGKWAVVYKPEPCCGKYQAFFGAPFIVTKISIAGFAEYECSYCGADVPDGTVMIEDQVGDVLEARICKRLNDPPAEEPATETTSRELAEQ